MGTAAGYVVGGLLVAGVLAWGRTGLRLKVRLLRPDPDLLRRFGEELLSEAIPILYTKIQTYDLHYRDRNGNSKPVKFVSYIWKRIDGHILDGVKRELEREKELQGDLVITGE
ncbi:MAG: hypothetical protein HYZ73_05455 [Elusimicrobia bacterium]|nr:hypothetical protein [Elusimicrobiota bacterium]